MSILIGADIVPTKSNYDLFKNGIAVALVGRDLLKIINEADYRIFNLEVPITDIETPIPKCGPNLIAPCNTVNGLKALGINLLTLANNHILDQDVQGLDSTKKVLDEAGIAYLGVGNTPEEAAKPFVFENAGKKIGVYACAEHEFSIVSVNRPGANPYDSLESFDHVAKLKKECDFVIVLYHGGKEHYRYPSPNLRKVFRKFADKGADLVIAQHTHCIGCMEKYKGSVLLYGQGNFLFDDDNSEYWQTSILVKINDDFSTEYVSLEKNKNTVRLATDKRAEDILSGFESRSEEIKNPENVEKKYAEFASSMMVGYLKILSGRKGIIFRMLNKVTKGLIGKKMYNKQGYLALADYLDCEAHRELLVYGLNELTQRKGK